jgi:putative hydrolase of the HAD superfamily
MNADHRPVLVLDAMGVLYWHADDVDDLLVPFIAEVGGSRDVAHINRQYLEASLGRLAPEAFWTSVGLDPRVEDSYLERHRLFPGLLTFLASATARFAALACLSNDVGSWSRKLRERHALTRSIGTWVVSGDVGFRKPSPVIYRMLLERIGAVPGQVWFVDDRSHNLGAARDLGIRTVCMRPNGVADKDHETVQSMEELLVVLDRQR